MGGCWMTVEKKTQGRPWDGGRGSGRGMPYICDVFSTRTAQEHSTHLLPHLKPDHRVLDVGCGTGSITVGLAKLVPKGHVVGFDISPQSPDQGRSAATEAGIRNIEFVQGDIEHLLDVFGGQKGTFDVVHMHQVLLYLPEPVTRLQQMQRLLKKGGILTTRDSSDLHRYPDNDRLQRERAVFEKIIAAKGGCRDAGHYSHTWFHEAGWPWNQLQYGSVAWEWSGKETTALVAAGAKNSMRNAAVEGGFATDKEMDEFGRG